MTSEWRSIKSAPCDGQFVLLTDGAVQLVARVIDGYWQTHAIDGHPEDIGHIMNEPTHWMPLPHLPSQ